MAISVNKVQLVGRLGGDPEQRGGGSGPVVFSVATSESWKDKNSGERKEKTFWHNVVVWNEATKGFLVQYAHKGDLVYVEGQLETSSYDKDGETRYKTEVVVKPFGGNVQIQSKDSGSSNRSEERDFGGSRESSGSRYNSGGGGSSSGRPGSNRAGQGGGYVGGIDDDIPFAPQVD